MRRIIFLSPKEKMKTKSYKLILILSVIFFFLNIQGLAIPERTVTFLQIEGKVMVRRAEDRWVPADKKMVLREKDEIITGEDGYAKILLDGGQTGEVEIRKNSYLRLDTLKISPVTGEKITLLDLALGSVLIQVQRLESTSKFEVKTPTAIAGVRGTLFEVNVERED